jgi:hypothetical protein
MSKETKHWIPVWMRRSWVRDWLCPICCLIPAVMVSPSWWIILAYPLLAGALSTYWDFLFGFDNFWFAGFMCGIAGMILILSGFAWWILLIRALAIAITWGAWCAISKNDFVEEYSRGFNLSFSSILFLL